MGVMSESPSKQFPYPELPQGNAIRLLLLSPGNFSDPIVCTLSSVHFSSKPKYTALSYTWDDQNASQAALLISAPPPTRSVTQTSDPKPKGRDGKHIQYLATIVISVALLFVWMVCLAFVLVLSRNIRNDTSSSLTTDQTIEKVHSDVFTEQIDDGTPNESTTDKTFTILINGHRFAVRRNLHLALLHLRSATHPLTLWVDAICINQKDLKERSHQVAIMAFVYNQAEVVISWLGAKKYRDGNDLIDQMQEEWTSGKTKTFAAWRAGEVGIKYSGNPSRDELNHIETNPYWSRIWVIQEVCLARQLVFAYGSSLWHYNDVKDWRFLKSSWEELGEKMQGDEAQTEEESTGEEAAKGLSFQRLKVNMQLTELVKDCSTSAQKAVEKMLSDPKVPPEAVHRLMEFAQNFTNKFLQSSQIEQKDLLQGESLLLKARLKTQWRSNRDVLKKMMEDLRKEDRDDEAMAEFWEVCERSLTHIDEIVDPLLGNLDRENKRNESMSRLIKQRELKFTNDMDLEILIEKFSKNECADTKDKIYGLVGLACDVASFTTQDDEQGSVDNENFLIDYSRSLYEIWADCVKHMFLHAQPLESVSKDAFEKDARSIKVVRFAGIVQAALDQRVGCMCLSDRVNEKDVNIKARCYYAGKILELGPGYDTFIESFNVQRKWVVSFRKHYHKKADLEKLRRMEDAYSTQIRNYSEEYLGCIQSLRSNTIRRPVRFLGSNHCLGVASGNARVGDTIFRFWGCDAAIICDGLSIIGRADVADVIDKNRFLEDQHERQAIMSSDRLYMSLDLGLLQKLTSFIEVYV